MSFDHVMETACAQTTTLLYVYFYVWELDLRLNNVMIDTSRMYHGEGQRVMMTQSAAP